MKNDEIFRLLDERDKQHAAEFTVVRGLIIARADLQDMELKAIKDHNVRQNGMLKTHEDKINDCDKWKTKCKTRDRIIWIGLSGVATLLGGVIVTNWNKIFN